MVILILIKKYEYFVPIVIMTTPLILNHRENWLLQGSPNDPRLLHSDPSDRVLVYPSHVGEGYRQTIRLREDLALVILDYKLKRDVVVKVPREKACAKFEFPVANANAGYSHFVPNMGLGGVTAGCTGKRVFEIEVVFKRAAIKDYVQACLERLPSQTRQIIESMATLLWRVQGGYPSLTTAEILNRLATYFVKGEIAPQTDMTLEQVLPRDLYTKTVDLYYANRCLMTPPMETIMGQILACPYHGAVRRTYLERKVMELVTLRLQAIAPPRLNPADLNYIYQAASILREQVVNPPTVEALARQISTNRLKLNQGFHEVYGTTPYSYLRDCRLRQAQQLLVTSELPVAKVAATVGYSSRNHFAKAFRRQFGLNPKTFQMQAWQWAS